MIRVGITGGIGSGKSTVCRLFAAKGIAVYDSDAAARRLMNESRPLRRALVERFGDAVYRAGELDRKFLAGIVFSDPAALADLDALVHPVVRADFETWCARQTGDYVVLESAILFESGFDSLVDRTVAVLAPAEVRVARVCRRDGSDPEAVRQRIAAQADDDTLRDRADFALVNISEPELGPAVDDLDRRFRHANQIVGHES
ncbi:MAG: dephospho-CoA kinase [Alistipes sp.]|nr:dephospho-CoA kinase [Alistipes sp.]